MDRGDDSLVINLPLIDGRVVVKAAACGSSNKMILISGNRVDVPCGTHQVDADGIEGIEIVFAGSTSRSRNPIPLMILIK